MDSTARGGILDSGFAVFKKSFLACFSEMEVRVF